MKISRNTPDQLIIENQPWLVAVLLGVMMLVFFGVGLSILMAGDTMTGLLLALGTPLFFGLFFWAFVRRNQLILDAVDGQVTHSRRTLTGYTRQTFELAHFDPRQCADQQQRRQPDTPYGIAYCRRHGRRHPSVYNRLPPAGSVPIVRPKL